MSTFDDRRDSTDRDFSDRRSRDTAPGRTERRQFGNSHAGLSPDARELAEAIDNYKLKHSRRFITFEEMLQVIQDLGYLKQPVPA